IMGVGSGGHHTSTCGESGNNAGNFAPSGGGGHGNNATAVFRQRRATKKIQLAADTGIDIGANRVGTDLTAGIHLKGAVDGDHIVVLANHLNIVDIFGVQQYHFGIVITKIVETATAQHKGADN